VTGFPGVTTLTPLDPDRGPVAAPAPPAAVARQAAGGALWLTLALGAGKVLAFVSNLVLARLLQPQDFGVVSFAMVMIGAFTRLQDLGVPAAIVFTSRDVAAVGGTALTINVAAAVFLLGVTVLAAPYLAAVGGDPAIGPVATALAVGLVVTATGSVQNALLARDLEFRRRFPTQVVPVVVSGIVSAALAVAGWGAWSLVIGYLSRAVVGTVLLWTLTPARPRPAFHRPIAAELLRYGGHVSLGTVIGFAATNVDYLIVGHRLGATSLGVYSLAFVIANALTTSVGQVVSTVAFSALSRLVRAGGGVWSTFSDLLRLSLFAGLAVHIPLFILAPYTPLMLGDKWADIVAPLQILAICGLFRFVVVPFTPMYKSLGRPDMLWMFNLLRVVTLAPAMLWATRYGIVAVALVQLPVSALLLPLNCVVLARVARVPVSGLWRLMAPHAAGAVLATFLVLAWHTFAGPSGLEVGPLGPAALAGATLAAYTAAAVSLQPRLMEIARAGIAHARGGRP
jgi:lipopolysaccharide exporter